MLHHRITSLALLAAVWLLPGCLGVDGSPTAADPEAAVEAEEQGAIQAVMTEDEDALALSSADLFFYEPSGVDGAQGAPIKTRHWRREVQSVDKKVSIVINKPDEGPATAHVTKAVSILGVLHLLASTEDGRLHVTKPFDDLAQLQLYFVRHRPDRPQLSDVRHRGWRLAAVSGVDIASEGTTRNIRGVRVQAGDVDETITSVSELTRVQNLMQLPPRSRVHITVATGDPTDGVFVHVERRHRMALTSNGDGTFSGAFATGDRPGPKHFVVDVLSEGTLYDDEAPYDNVAWGIPYFVRGIRPTDNAGGA